MNPKEVFHNTAYWVQLPYIAGHYLYRILKLEFKASVQFVKGIKFLHKLKFICLFIYLYNLVM